MSGSRLPRPEPRRQFRSRLRSELLAEAARLAEQRRRGPWLFTWMRPALVTAAIALLLVGGAGAAAAGSMPGDPAYGLKRAFESAEVALARSDESRVQLLAQQAQRRLGELELTVTRPEKAPTASEEYQAAVERFAAAVERLRAVNRDKPEDKEEAKTARREAVEDVVACARAKHVPVLEGLKERLPAGAQQGLERALEQHQQLSQGGRPSSSTGRPSDLPGRGNAPATPSPTPSPTPTPPPDDPTPNAGLVLTACN